MGGEELAGMMFRAAQRRPGPRSAYSEQLGGAQRCDRPPAALPRPPSCAGSDDGRGEGSIGVRGRGKERGHGGGGGRGTEREGAGVASPLGTTEAAGRNSEGVTGGSVGDGAERASRSVVSREGVGNRGGDGGGALGTKRWRELAARPPPPKRRAVSATRKFPPGCGRDAAVQLAAGSRGDGPLHAAAAPPIAASEDCLLLEAVLVPALAALSEAKKVAIPGGGGSSTANLRRHRHVPVDAVLTKSSHASDENRAVCKTGSLEKVAETGKGARCGEVLGRDEVRGSAALPKWRMVLAKRRFPPGCGRDVVNPIENVSTFRKAVQSPIKENHKPALGNLQRPFSTSKESVATSSTPFGPQKKLKTKGSAQGQHLPLKFASVSALVNKDYQMDEETTKLEDDDILKALAVHEGTLELYLNSNSCVQRHRQHGSQNADDRSKIRMLCRRFQFLCRSLVQASEQGLLKVRRVDLEAGKIIRKLPGFTKPCPTIGNVRGVEIGDEFLYRVELAIVGIHRPYQGGIDAIYHNGLFVAISIVASGGYPDELSSTGEVIYTGSGGRPAGKKKDEDQKLERGNLALRNCIKTRTPVRVIHGFKGQNREEGSHSRAKQISTFTYDGLYLVEDCWREGQPGSKVLKYRLQRIPGQPELPLHIAKGLKKSAVRPGLCKADISQGKEMVPICVINDVDNIHLASFKYIARIEYPSWLTKRHPQHHGCVCTDGCIDFAKCSCAVKNGGKIPFNFNGAIVHKKPIIFECGSSCRCHSSCHNRVSQNGMKIPLEVFRTANKGWGVRSLRSISSGSFICEYVGVVRTGKEAEKRTNNEYLFDISHNYDDEDNQKGRTSTIPGPCFQTMEDAGFTIDASEYGNVGRFINHSCSPNLYVQNVIWDHDDLRVPHIMFFAAENIPPLQELAYDYNYKIGRVHHLNDIEEDKRCYCGSSQCCGRLFEGRVD